jgi:hypothetical protein
MIGLLSICHGKDFQSIFSPITSPNLRKCLRDRGILPGISFILRGKKYFLNAEKDKGSHPVRWSLG